MANDGIAKAAGPVREGLNPDISQHPRRLLVVRIVSPAAEPLAIASTYERPAANIDRAARPLRTGPKSGERPACCCDEIPNFPEFLGYF
jgi:hypothetical protein